MLWWWRDAFNLFFFDETLFRKKWHSHALSRMEELPGLSLRVTPAFVWAPSFSEAKYESARWNDRVLKGFLRGFYIGYFRIEIPRFKPEPDPRLEWVNVDPCSCLNSGTDHDARPRISQHPLRLRNGYSHRRPSATRKPDIK